MRGLNIDNETPFLIVNIETSVKWLNMLQMHFLQLKYLLLMSYVKAAIQANERQKHRMVAMMAREMGNLYGKHFGVLGLAFKNNTDDIREYYFFDLRNIYSKESMNELGFKYFSVGRV